MTRVLITPRSFGKMDPSLFERMEALGWELVRNPFGTILNEAQLIELIADCDGMIAGVDPITADVLRAAPRLKAIARYGVGTDNVDLDYCREHQIAVSRTLGANTEAVADYTFALIMAVARKLVQIDRQCRVGNWQKMISGDVYGKTLGLVGLGAIGRAVARRAQGFSMKILAFDVQWDARWAEDHQVERVSLETLYRQSDFISLHVPLLPETRMMIGEKELAMFRAGSVLINTARGGLIDESALLAALQSGHLAGAGLDAFEKEPPENPLWFSLPQVVLGSHTAASTELAAREMGRMALDNLIRDLA